MSNRSVDLNVVGLASVDTPPPHLLSFMIDDISKISADVSRAFDAANKLTVSCGHVDEGFVSGGSSSTHTDLDRTIHALDLRLGVTRGQVDDIRHVNFEGLQSISNKLICLAALRLVQAVTEIGAIGSELRQLFCGNRHDAHYDSDHTVRQSLNSTERECREIGIQLTDLANSFNPPTSPAPHGARLCVAARSLIDGHDDGHVNYIDTKFLTKNEKEKLWRQGGSFQYWKCSECGQEIKYYIRQSRTSMLLNTPEVCTFDSKLKYRKAMLAKSHLHKVHTSTANLTFACLLCLADGKDLHRGRTAFHDAENLLQHLGKHHNATSLPSLLMNELRFVGPSQTEGSSLYDLKFL